MRIELPWPAAVLAPNRKNGHHWGSVHSVKTQRKRDAHALTLQAVRSHICHMPPSINANVNVSVTFHPPDRRRRDLDNLLAALKPDFDGISQAIGVDDQHFHPLTLRRGEIVKGGCVVVVLDVEKRGIADADADENRCRCR